MADSTPNAATPTAPAAPSTPAPGTSEPASTPGSAPGTSTPKKPEETVEHWQQRHAEATDTIRKQGESLKKYRETYGEFDDAPEAPDAPENPSDDTPVTQSQFQDFTLSQQLGRTPSLVPHKEEVKKLVASGAVSFEEACETVAKRHNITLGPKPDALEMMPTDAGTGGAPPASQDFTSQQKEALQKEGKDPEKLKKHLPILEKAWKKALKR